MIRSNLRTLYSAGLLRERVSPIPNSLGSSPEFTTVSVIKEAGTLCVSIFPEQNETFEWDDLEYFI